MKKFMEILYTPSQFLYVLFTNYDKIRKLLIRFHYRDFLTYYILL